MVQAIIFDCFGVIIEVQRETKDQALLEFIRGLRGRYRTAMLSNITRAGLERHFVPGELEQYFDAVIASGDIGFAKPEPQAFHLTAGWLGVPPAACVMVDDTSGHCAGARAAGLQAIEYHGLPALKSALQSIVQ